jgi:hypothetical protein
MTYLPFSQKYGHKTRTHTPCTLTRSELSTYPDQTTSGAHGRPIRATELYHVIQHINCKAVGHQGNIVLNYYQLHTCNYRILYLQ